MYQDITDFHETMCDAAEVPDGVPEQIYFQTATAHRTRIKTQYPATNHPFALNRYCYTRVLYERWAMSADNDPLQHEERILCTNCKQFSLYQECAHAYAAHCLRSGVAPATALVTSKSINTTFGFNGNQDSRVVIILH
eukprot:GEMP01119598.1.p2 GENE.GEMP01119598.1~~GEMP01119598.1.p2  ORF type:complete len:138 (-),score=9.87 GEMP01119598.1:22-435(-)